VRRELWLYRGYTTAAALEASRLNEVRVGVNYRFGGL
jgi:hypothetical protein